MFKDGRITCNKCGKLLGKHENFISIDETMPYGSKYDMDSITLDLCCDCMDELIDSCKVNPLV